MTHDGYLKIWAKTNPKLAAYDFIFLDESQDTNPVTLDVLMRQRLHKTTGLVFVGDTHKVFTVSVALLMQWRNYRKSLR